MVESVVEEEGRGRVDYCTVVLDDAVCPSINKVVHATMSAEPKLKVPSGKGKYAPPSQSSLSHTSDGLTYTVQKMKRKKKKAELCLLGKLFANFPQLFAADAARGFAHSFVVLHDLMLERPLIAK